MDSQAVCQMYDLCTQDGESNCNDGSQQAVVSPASSSIGLQANLTDQQLQTALMVRHCSHPHRVVPVHGPATTVVPNHQPTLASLCHAMHGARSEASQHSANLKASQHSAKFESITPQYAVAPLSLDWHAF